MPLYTILTVNSDIAVYGPFKTELERVKAARELSLEVKDEGDSLRRMTIQNDVPLLEDFTSDELDFLRDLTDYDSLSRSFRQPEHPAILKLFRP